MPSQTSNPQTSNGHSGHGAGTLAVHAGTFNDPVTGAVIEPISLSTTYAQTSPGEPIGPYDYSRVSNPNRTSFETAVAALEGGKHALAFASGSATTATIVQSIGAGKHVVCLSDVYGGTYRYFSKVASINGVDVTYVKSLESELEKSIRPGSTEIVWVESPSNPTLSLTDIARVVEIAHRHGLTVVVDNTFASPIVQKPLDFGADIVVHSVTKFLNGHSDVIMGCLVTNDDAIHERLEFFHKSIGACPSSFDAWLAHRGLKTLHLRVRESSRNADLVARALEGSPHVRSVNYPGLDSHPQHAIAVKQHRNGLNGGMLSFRINGDAATATRFCQETRIFTLAESLGGIESLCEVPAVMTHAAIPKEVREEHGVYDDLIRISCGIEDGEDLVGDILSAVERAVTQPGANGKTIGHA